MVKWYQEQNAHGASSKFGQMIGEAFEDQVFSLITTYLESVHPQYVLLEPSEGKKMVRLEMFGGTSRQMDNVIIPVNSDEPVALLESKWLKDGRHHNDKGAWILQLREVRKRYPTVRGAVANLAGYWTDGVTVMFESEGRIRMVLVATDEEIYGTLQPSVDDFCTRHHLPALQLNANEIRNSLPRSWDLANCLIELHSDSRLSQVAQSWLDFPRTQSEDGQSLSGRDLIQTAIDEVLGPLPDNPDVEKLEIALQISTGNTIYQEFTDGEEAFEFIRQYLRNPKAILDRITPKPRNVRKDDPEQDPSDE
jgi:hypothetical protein